MPANIKFIAGRRAPARYVYRDTDLFEPGLLNASAEPLRLSDFKNIEILSESTWHFCLRCHFNDETEAVAVAEVEMMRILQQFIYNKKDTPNGQQPEFPISGSNTLVFVLIAVVVFLICMIYIIK